MTISGTGPGDSTLGGRSEATEPGGWARMTSDVPGAGGSGCDLFLIQASVYPSKNLVAGWCVDVKKLGFLGLRGILTQSGSSGRQVSVPGF